MKRMLLVFLLGVMIVFCWTVGIAGDFYVVPGKKQVTSWDKKIAGSARFKLVLDGEAVLDRETGLVWQRNTDNPKRTWLDACSYCYQLNVGGRMGWRPPAVEELATLVDTSNSNPALPTGHLFTNPKSFVYWSSSTVAGWPDLVWSVYFSTAYVSPYDKDELYHVRCVRSGHGYDGR